MANPADDSDSGYVVVHIGIGKALLFHSGRCVECESCVFVCPEKALAIVSYFGKNV